MTSVALPCRHTLAPGGPGLFVGPPCVLLQQYYFGYGVFYLSKRAPFNIDNCSPGRHQTIQLSIQLSCSLQVRITASKRSIRRFKITEKAPTRALSWLRAPTSAFTFKTLLRHYAKRELTPRSLNVKLGPRHKGHKGRAGWLA